MVATQGAVDLLRFLYIDSNTIKFWITIALSAGIGYGLYHSILLSLVILILMQVAIDTAYYFLHIVYYDPDLSVARGYTWSLILNDTPHSEGLDYGFNFYDGDYTKKPAVAQHDKFEYAVKTLGIRKGDRVIDIGCGCGDWLYFLQNEMQCKVAGINITAAQAKECHDRGLECHVSDWKLVSSNRALRSKLFGQFDVVTCWDTVEHYVSMSQALGKVEARDRIYQDLFTLIDNLLDDKCRPHLKARVWISCLHMRNKLFDSRNPMETQWRKMFSYYLLEKMHSGFYPSYYVNEWSGKFRDGLVDNAKKVGFELNWRKDVTIDYYMTSTINATHFGRHKFAMTPLKLLGLVLNTVVDPFSLQRILWMWLESWMGQFNPADMDKSDVVLFWMTWKKAN